MADTDRSHSARELHDLLRRSGDGVGPTTVYRHLQALAEGGAADVRRSGGGQARYRACATREHHPLLCRACGRSVVAAGRAVERCAVDVAEQHGDTDVTRTLEVCGTCGACSSG